MRWLVRTVIAVTAAATMACGLVIGLDERKARPTSPNATDAGDGASAPSAFCTQDNTLFCDDFEDPSQDASVKWKGLENGKVLPSRVVNNGASLAIIEFPPAANRGPSLGLEVTVPSVVSKDPTLALLVNQVNQDLDPGAGVHLSWDYQLLTFEDDRADAHPTSGPDSGIFNEAKTAVATLQTINAAKNLFGVTFLVGPDGAYITETKNDPNYRDYIRITKASLDRFGDPQWAQMGLGTGPRDKMLDFIRGLRGTQLATIDCPAEADFVIVAWASFEPGAICITAQKDFHPMADHQPIGVSVGSLVDAPARILAHFDNVRLEAVP